MVKQNTDNLMLLEEDMQPTRAATLATEDNHGIVKIEGIDDTLSCIKVEFKDGISTECIRLVKNQGFIISTCSTNEKSVTLIQHTKL
jgi:hypothetical protein